VDSRTKWWRSELGAIGEREEPAKIALINVLPLILQIVLAYRARTVGAHAGVVGVTRGDGHRQREGYYYDGSAPA
jgi:hypothetical protein